MIFAAGFGTRMQPLTLTTPKPLIPVAGQTLLDRTIGMAQAVNPDRIVVNAHHLAEQVEQHLSGRDIRVIHEHDRILDTGGGLKNALPHMTPGPVWAMNSDAVWKGPNPLTLMQDHWNPDIMDALLICVPIENTRGYTRPGDIELSRTGQITWGNSYVYGGVQIINPAVLEPFLEPVFSLKLVWDKLVDQGRAFGCVYPGLWADVGHPEGIGIAEDMLAE